MPLIPAAGAELAVHSNLPDALRFSANGLILDGGMVVLSHPRLGHASCRDQALIGVAAGCRRPCGRLTAPPASAGAAAGIQPWPDPLRGRMTLLMGDAPSWQPALTWHGPPVGRSMEPSTSWPCALAGRHPRLDQAPEAYCPARSRVGALRTGLRPGGSFRRRLTRTESLDGVDRSTCPCSSWNWSNGAVIS